MKYFKDKFSLGAKGITMGQMFTLNVNMLETSMARYAQDAKVVENERCLWTNAEGIEIKDVTI